ncbi:hypothetical protein F5876DRAFT_10306, partial [Lentinula aff. lateritia]
VVVTDELGSAADFVLVEVLRDGRKGGKKAMILSVSGSVAKWGSVLGKYNIPAASEAVHFVDVVDVVEESGLGGVVDRVEGFLRGGGGNGGVVILDDISTLEWIGIASGVELGRFCRALRGVCQKNHTMLLIRHHSTNDEVFGGLHALCTYHVDVQPLASGPSAAVSGQIALHRGPNTTSTSASTRPRSKALQYKLTDTSAIYFERGT